MVGFADEVGTLANLIPAATAACVAALEPHTTADWRATAAGDLDWSCWDTALHIADDLYFYAVQLVDGRPGPGYLSTELALDADATVRGLLRAIPVHGELLRRAALGAGPSDRGYHVYGISDSEGFAAMGIVETLVHTYDIVRGLVPTTIWRPPPELALPVLRRLFPDAPPGDASDVLLYSCGREPLRDRPRQGRWRWDGSVRTDLRP